MMTSLIVRNLTTEFRSQDRWLRVVDGASFHLNGGEILGLVGESGCGKSTTALSLVRLLPKNGRIVSGELHLDGVDLMKVSEDEMRRLRGSHLSMMFQDPMTSLDPAFTVGDQVAETIREHMDLGKAEAIEKTVELFRLVGIPAPRERIGSYPHQLSGGMRQRVGLAIAISCHPQVFIADEPTTAVDVTIQAQILRLIKKHVVSEQQAGVILITHDLGIVAQTCDRVAVMYAGNIVEIADTVSLFSKPLHPYTQALLASVLTRGVSRGKLPTIEGSVPDLSDLPPGCPFHPRCPHAMSVCSSETAPRVDLNGGEVACFLYRE
jgi:oligopeptide/dipeptide ABC transporter ATP-binding protein